MRTVLLMVLLGPIGWAEDAFGIWKVSPARSMFVADRHPQMVTLRIERHTKGEVFTWEQIREKGEKLTTSMILYLDGKEREFHGDSCFGSQASRRVDAQTVEIVYRCRDGWARWVRRLPLERPEMILDITEHLSDGRRFERRLVLDKQ